jgi:hypothetical protein
MEVTVQVRVPVVVPVTDVPSATVLPSVSIADMEASEIPSSYPLRLGVSEESGFKSPEVNTGPETPEGVISEVAPWGASAETPRAEESLKTIVCTIGVGLPSGPRIAAVVVVV